jgi:hypothetical protein
MAAEKTFSVAGVLSAVARLFACLASAHVMGLLFRELVEAALGCGGEPLSCPTETMSRLKNLLFYLVALPLQLAVMWVIALKPFHDWDRQRKETAAQRRGVAASRQGING